MVATTIYIPLLEEGTECYRPTLGEEVGQGIYRVLPTENYDPEDEIWEFPPGTVVRCLMEKRHGSEGESDVLVAREKIG